MVGHNQIIHDLFAELAERGDVLHASYGGIIGLIIAVMRRQKGYSQNQLAHYSGVSQPTISRVELGEAELTTYQLYKIAESFGVTPSFMLGVADEFERELKARKVSVSPKASEATLASVAGASAIVAAGASLGGPVGLLLGAAVGAIIKHYAKKARDDDNLK